MAMEAPWLIASAWPFSRMGGLHVAPQSLDTESMMSARRTPPAASR